MKNAERAQRARIGTASRADRQASGKRRVARRVPPFPGSGTMLAVPPLPSMKAAARTSSTRLAHLAPEINLAPPPVARLSPAPTATLNPQVPPPVVGNASAGAPRRSFAIVAGVVGVLLIAAGLGLGFLPAAQRKLASAASRAASSAQATSTISARPQAAAHE